jgi:YfiH family protein
MQPKSGIVTPECFNRGSMKCVFSNVEGLISLTSDASIDFTPTDFDSPLTAAQRAYLQKISGQDIPQVFWRKQIHGDDILVAQKSSVIASEGKQSIIPIGCPDADAYITNEKNLPIAIRTADCVPVFIFDPRHRVIGLAHAGWKGTHKSIASKTVLQMQAKYGSLPADLKIFLGPSIHECCYQVGQEFRGFFPSNVKERDGHLYLDVISANRDQLLQAGVLSANILDSGICTSCHKNYFSHRRDAAKAGRMISLMLLV